jgi:hypothetical protein
MDIDRQLHSYFSSFILGAKNRWSFLKGRLHMPYEIRHCRAPRVNLPQLECGNEFTTQSMNQIYCCDTCRNRAQKHNKLRRKRGFGYGLGQQAARIANPPTTYDTAKVDAAATHTTAEVERALAIQKLIEVDSEAELLALGYSANKKAERWADDTRAAEPKLSTPKSDENNPPQFKNEEYQPNPDDPYADYQAPEGSDL